MPPHPASRGSLWPPLYLHSRDPAPGTLRSQVPRMARKVPGPCAPLPCLQRPLPSSSAPRLTKPCPLKMVRVSWPWNGLLSLCWDWTWPVPGRGSHPCPRSSLALIRPSCLGSHPTWERSHSPTRLPALGRQGQRTVQALPCRMGSPQPVPLQEAYLLPDFLPGLGGE